jgi:hypothetical protein
MQNRASSRGPASTPAAFVGSEENERRSPASLRASLSGGNIVRSKNDLDATCINTIRTLSMDAVQPANSGHPGAPMALAPVAYCLWQQFLRFEPLNRAILFGAGRQNLSGCQRFSGGGRAVRTELQACGNSQPNNRSVIDEYRGVQHSGRRDD